MFFLNNKKSGFGLLEVVIASAIITVSLGALILSFINTMALEENNLRKTQAVFLAEEGLEIVRGLRSESWENINTYGQYSISCSSGDCVLVGVDDSLISGLFTREIEIAPAYRDNDNKLVESGELDEDTVFVTVSVSWFAGQGLRTEVLQTYFTNIFEN